MGNTQLHGLRTDVGDSLDSERADRIAFGLRLCVPFVAPLDDEVPRWVSFYDFSRIGDATVREN